MKVFIERYRGYDIYFSTEEDTFVSEMWKKASFSAIKRSIDEFLKKNDKFISFNVEKLPSKYSEGSIYEVIGISPKTDKFCILDANGNREYVSEYSEKDYVLLNDKNSSIKSKIIELNKDIDDIRKEIDELEKQYEIKTLKDIKSQYTGVNQ